MHVAFQSNLKIFWGKINRSHFLAHWKSLEYTVLGVYTIILPEALLLNYDLRQIVIYTCELQNNINLS